MRSRLCTILRIGLSPWHDYIVKEKMEAAGVLASLVGAHLMSKRENSSDSIHAQEGAVWQIHVWDLARKNEIAKIGSLHPRAHQPGERLAPKCSPVGVCVLF